MIECARPPDSSMYVPLPPAQVFNKSWATSYEYYAAPYDPCIEPEIEPSANIYHQLTSRNYPDQIRDEWKWKVVEEWTEDDTMSWFVEALRSLELSEFDWPPSKFRIPGFALRGMSREEVVERMTNYTFDPAYTRRCGEKVFEKLSNYLCGYVDNQYHSQEQGQVLDLDKFNNRERIYEYSHEPIPQTATDSSSNDAEDYNYHNSETPSPEYGGYGSDASKSGDELDDKRKVVFKRPPGRPKGSGRKVCKRPRSESVPEFLKNLILNPQYCPSIIKWEDYNRGMFRFVKPDDVAKLWGTQKQNDSMTFEKFSRAMRYHYRNSVLVSVPTQRLVYQFGPKGPDYRTDNPNFTKVKSELDVHNENLYS